MRVLWAALYTYVGSLAMFKNRQTFSIEPFSSKSCLKKRAVSIFTYQREEREREVKTVCVCGGGGGGAEGQGCKAHATYTHSSEDDGKVVFMVVYHSLGLIKLHQATLATDLSSNLQ